MPDEFEDEAEASLIDCEIARLELHPGDVLVVFSEEKLSPIHRQIIEENIEAKLPGSPVLILDDGKRLAVVSRGGHEHPGGRLVESGGNPAGDAGGPDRPNGTGAA